MFKKLVKSFVDEVQWWHRWWNWQPPQGHTSGGPVLDKLPKPTTTRPPGVSRDEVLPE